MPMIFIISNMFIHLSSFNFHLLDTSFKIFKLLEVTTDLILTQQSELLTETHYSNLDTGWLDLAIVTGWFFKSG